MYAKEIGRNRVMKLIEKGAMLIDMRTPVEFRDGTVNGAINLPLRNMLNKIMAVPRNTTLVFFSNEGDDDLNIASKYAIELGFSDVYISNYTTLRD